MKKSSCSWGSEHTEGFAVGHSDLPVSRCSPVLGANSLQSPPTASRLQVTSVAVLLTAEPAYSSQKLLLHVSWLLCIKKLNLSRLIFYVLGHLIFLKNKKKKYYFPKMDCHRDTVMCVWMYSTFCTLKVSYNIITEDSPALRWTGELASLCVFLFLTHSTGALAPLISLKS